MRVQVRAMGFSPAVTIDCGFFGYVNLGKRSFRFAPPDGCAAVQAFIQTEREAAYKLTSARGSSATTASGQLRATSGGSCVRLQGLKILRSLDWSAWGEASITLSGVLLTTGKHYFELQAGQAAARRK